MAETLRMCLSWWCCLFFLGAAFLPLTRRLLPGFFDGGYLFAKAIGIAACAYAGWLLSSLGLADFSAGLVSACAGAGLCCNLLLARCFPCGCAAPVKNHLAVLAGEELLFTALLALWWYIRSLQPDIRGLEKFMDYGFVASLLRSGHMPPADMWFAGKTVNYYYFGHYVCAFLTRLSRCPAPVAYNLMIGTLFALTASLGFSLAANALFLLKRHSLKQCLAAGAIAGALLAFGGSLHTAIYAYLIPGAARAGFIQTPAKPYHYPDATRYIGHNPPTEDKTIHEFPHYSFVVADLHAHVNNIPFVLTMLALLLASLVSASRHQEACAPPYTREFFSILLPQAFFLSVFIMTNGWDAPIYLALAIAVLVIRQYAILGACPRALGQALARLSVVVAGMCLFALPFLLHFKNFSSGINLVHARSPLYQLAVLWGYQAAFAVTLAACAASRAAEQPLPEHTGTQGASSLPDYFMLLLCLAAFCLIAAPEFIYVKDIYIPSHHRANTMFKLTYQAFILLSIATGCTAIRMLPVLSGHVPGRIWGMLLWVCIGLALLYPLKAIPGYYGMPAFSRCQGLNGLKFLERESPEDYLMILWLSASVQGQPVIVEADGDSYTDCGITAMATGLPTILGWTVHEWLWRGSREAVTLRSRDIAAVYEGENAASVKNILAKYRPAYIIISRRERQKFKKLNESLLLQLGTVVFHVRDTLVLKVGLDSSHDATGYY
ncbi:MAG: hypothetical protein JW832_13615 [Deltaproteobacteria bacterium]|nr:hypothetical protein [Deltaproteobacteria bacterium]